MTNPPIQATSTTTPSTPKSNDERHTPGPWYLKRSGTIAQRESGEVVATCGYQVAAGSDEDDANASLIAAAPTLLAACRSAVSALRSYQYGNGSPDLAESIADSIDLAIANAEGR